MTKETAYLQQIHSITLVTDVNIALDFFKINLSRFLLLWCIMKLSFGIFQKLMKFIHSSAFCQNCGENISKEIAFCRSCGTALSEEQVRLNIERSRQETSIHVPVQDETPRSARQIAGTVVIGFLEFLFVIIVFFVSLIISMNFLPGFTDNRSGSLFSYFIVMMTACIAGLIGGSYLSRKFCEKYPEKVTAFKRLLCLEEKPA